MFEDGVVKYQFIANKLKNQIEEGHYQYGEAIPSENELTKLYDVSRHTIREAISLLVKDRYVRKEKGSGTYVSYDDKDQRQPDAKPLLVGVITTYLSDYIFPSIIRGIEKELNKENIGLLIASTHNNYADEESALKKMISNNVDGLIIEPTKSSYFNPNTKLYLDLNAKGIPFVMLNSTYSEFDTNSVGSNDERAGFIATEYLIKKGHSKILAIMKIDDKQGKYRLKGYVRAFADHQLSFANDAIVTYETEDKFDIQAKLEAIDLSQYTAVICYNDEVALQVGNYFNAKGIRIPEDISIVSHDDSILSDNFIPPITSVSHPKERLGIEAARWIVAAIRGQVKESNQMLFAPHIVEKASVKQLTDND